MSSFCPGKSGFLIHMTQSQWPLESTEHWVAKSVCSVVTHAKGCVKCCRLPIVICIKNWWRIYFRVLQLEVDSLEKIYESFSCEQIEP